MIELGKVLIKEETSIVEARNRIRLLAEDLKFNSFAATRLATITSELSRIVYEKDDGSSIVVGFDKREETFGLVLAFQSRKEELDAAKAEVFFDEVKIFHRKDGLRRIETFKYIPDPEFQPTKEFIEKEKERLIRFSREELVREVERKNEELSRLLGGMRREVTERLKESACLYAISNLLGNLDISLKEKLQATVDLIPSGWEYPGITCARINLGGQTFQTNNFKEAPWKQASDIVVDGKKAGTLEVCYLEERGKGDEGPFLKEGRNLIDTIAKRVAEHIETRRTEEALYKAYEELEIRVAERTKELQAVNKELEAFAYSVSHDLKAPLRAIDGFSQILLEDHRDKLNRKGKRVLGVIRGNTERMEHLIEDLLTFSRLGRKEMEESKINMEKLTRDVFEELKNVTPEQKLKIKINALAPAWGDESLIREVLTNLISNAIKFSKNEETSAIEVGGQLQDNENIYYVKDNGVGFDMKYSDKLFGVFQRLHTQKDFKGTGVGLSLVQRIIHRHGGRVWAEGKVNKGATFHFTLPKRKEK